MPSDPLVPACMLGGVLKIIILDKLCAQVLCTFQCIYLRTVCLEISSQSAL